MKLVPTTTSFLVFTQMLKAYCCRCCVLVHAMGLGCLVSLWAQSCSTENGFMQSNAQQYLHLAQGCACFVMQATCQTKTSCLPVDTYGSINFVYRRLPSQSYKTGLAVHAIPIHRSNRRCTLMTISCSCSTSRPTTWLTANSKAVVEIAMQGKAMLP